MRKAILLVTFLLATQYSLKAQGIEFYHGTFAEALQLAQEKNKIIFFDAYASWCGPCKRLSKNMFPREDVGKFFNEHFVSFKQDMEKGEGLQLRKKYPVSAYPTLFFIAPTGEVITKVKGAPRKPEDLINFAEKAIKLYDPTAKYARQYEEGTRDYDVMLGYVKALNQKGESSLRIANEYLDAQEELSTEANLRFIYEAMTRLDSKIFDMFTEHKKGLQKLYTPEELRNKVSVAADNSLQTALEYSSRDLMQEAVRKYANYDDNDGKAFEAEAYMAFALLEEDGDAYLRFAKESIDSDETPDNLFQISRDIFNHFPDHSKAMKSAEKWSEQAAEETKEPEQYYVYIQILIANEDEKKASKVLDECISMINENGGSAEKFEVLKSRLGGS